MPYITGVTKAGTEASRSVCRVQVLVSKSKLKKLVVVDLYRFEGNQLDTKMTISVMQQYELLCDIDRENLQVSAKDAE